MSRTTQSAVAILAACCVLTVLITPAFDELPSTAARSHLYSSTLIVVANVSLGLQSLSANSPSATTHAAALPRMGLLAQTCSRLI